MMEWKINTFGERFGYTQKQTRKKNMPLIVRLCLFMIGYGYIIC